MSGTQVWIPSKLLSWELASIIAFDEEKQEYLVSKSNGDGSDTTIILNKKDVFRTDPSHFIDTNDLCSMNLLSEGPLLNCLRMRFSNDKIYTTTGEVLISVNPYKLIPGLYDNILSYLDIPDDGTEIEKTASTPHVYCVANDALSELINGKKSSSTFHNPLNQSIIVSGESGAGKTEASKHVMNFLITCDQELGRLWQQSENQPGTSLALGDNIRRVLLESNIIFESFGNAKTVRNDNSSRFGKYIKLQYSDENRIISAFTETFLLEKSRLISIGANERNYHVFYQFLLSPTHSNETKSKLKILPPQAFKMLIDTNGHVVASPEDDLFEELNSALMTTGCSSEELYYLWSIIAAVLHMGNITCEAAADDSIKTNIISPTMPIEELTSLLGISPEMFQSRLTSQRVKISSRSSVTMKSLSALETMNNISALIKWIYSCLFSWLVDKVNVAHCSINDNIVKARKFIGILDIFGFEILQTNSFEQLCINFTNERLQQQFNEFVFEREQQEYRAEGLDWSSITYKDNQNVIDLIAKKPLGLLIILEEQGMLNRGHGDDGALVSSFNSNHDKKSSAYEKARFGNETFTIKHFAGDVTYIVAGFLEKNNDSLQEDLMELMVCSTNPFIQNAIVATALDTPGTVGQPGFVAEIPDELIVASAGSLTSSIKPSADTATAPVKKGRRSSVSQSEGVAPTSGGKKMASTVTVSFQFRSQLDLLLLTLRATSPHYIKCIKPNALKVRGAFTSHMVLEQLRYSGALEVVRIRQEGYPISLPFIVFYETFEVLAFKRGWTQSNKCSIETAKEYSSQLCLEIINPNNTSEYQIGHSKIYFKSESFEKIHLAVEKFLSKKVTKFQTLCRKQFAIKRYKIFLKGLKLLQSYVRKFSKKSIYKRKIAIKREEIRKAKELKEFEEMQLKLKNEAEKQAYLEKIRLEEELRLAEIEKQLAIQRKIEEDEKQAKIDYNNRIIALHESCMKGDMGAIEAMLSLHPEDYDTKNNQYNQATLLHSAVLSGNIELMKYFNPSKYELCMKDSQGNTPLHYALKSSSTNKLVLIEYILSIVESSGSNNDNNLNSSMEKLHLRPGYDTILPSIPTRRGSNTQSMRIKDNIQELDDKLFNNLIKKNVSSNNNTNNNGNNVLKSGWLSKRGESSIWRKRWVVLTTDSLMYFRNQNDKLPRDSLSFQTKNDIKIQRDMSKLNAIEVLINHQSVKKKRSRISLMAESEVEVQAWMNLLKASAGVESKQLRSVASAEPIKVVSPAVRKAAISVSNATKETPLHIIAAIPSNSSINTSNPTIIDISQVDQLLTSSWLISNGCPVNTFDINGHTPLHVAIIQGNFPLIYHFIRNGANLNAKINDISSEKSGIDLLKMNENQSFVEEIINSFHRYNSSFTGLFLPPPPTLKGFSYLTLLFHQHYIENQ
eukprot:gene11898-15921_t